MVYKFLVVDDDENIVSLTAEFVRKWFNDSQVRTAHTNQQAIQILAAFTPHLVITDIVRRGGSGLEFLSQLRAEPGTALIPVIAVSGSAKGKQELALYKHGFDAVVPKPWHAEQLIGAISRMLRIRGDPEVQLIHLGFETQSHDYKATVDLVSKSGRAALAKDVMAMANWGGGTIVVGVAEQRPGEFVTQGVADSLLSSL